MQLHRAALDAARANRDPGLEGWALGNLARCVEASGSWKEAVPLLADGLRKLDQVNDFVAIIGLLDIVGMVLSSGGDPPAATAAWRDAERLSQHLGVALDRDAARQALISAEREQGDQAEPPGLHPPIGIDDVAEWYAGRLEALA